MSGTPASSKREPTRGDDGGAKSATGEQAEVSPISCVVRLLILPFTKIRSNEVRNAKESFARSENRPYAERSWEKEEEVWSGGSGGAASRVERDLDLRSPTT